MIAMSSKEMSACFNHWMERYIDHPEEFKREMSTVNTFLKELEKKTPTYGELCTALMKEYHKELLGEQYV